MSYIPPTYVDTKAQAILALASVVADEDKTALGDGSVNRALDVLADALADSDVQVPQTNAGAILALAQYASGMIKPEGTITITENGTGIDVSQYATADVSVSGSGSTSTITLVEALNGDASDQLKLTIETIDGETIQATPTTISFEGDEFPVFTFDVDAGEVVTITADSGLAINDSGCMYGSNFDLDYPPVYLYPFSVDLDAGTTITIVATNTDSCVVVDIASDE